jgi:ribosomal protein L35
MGYKRPESQKMKQRRGENKCFKRGETGHFKRECPEWEREHRETVPLMSFDKE